MVLMSVTLVNNVASHNSRRLIASHDDSLYAQSRIGYAHDGSVQVFVLWEKVTETKSARGNQRAGKPTVV